MKKKTTKHVKGPTLKLTYYECGALFGAVYGTKGYQNLPRSLQLKLNIAFCEAYLSHASLGEQAKKDIQTYKKQLRLEERR